MASRNAAKGTSRVGVSAADRQTQRKASRKADRPIPPKPPKKPLTPYMLFSKKIWPEIKAEKGAMSSVVEVGAHIGNLWRGLEAEEKAKYTEQFTKDKARYDEELRVYLKTNGLMLSDVVKPRNKNLELTSVDD